MAIKNLSCEWCPKAFGTTQGLRNHRRSCVAKGAIDAVTLARKRQCLEGTGIAHMHEGGLSMPEFVEGSSGSQVVYDDDNIPSPPEPEPEPEPEAMPEPEPEAEPTPPPPTTRSGRTPRFPARFDDFLPNARTPLAHIPTVAPRADPRNIPPPAPSSPAPIDEDLHEEQVPEAPRTSVSTAIDDFGLFRMYPQQPLVIPEQDISSRTLYNAPRPPKVLNEANFPYYYPFSNPAAAATMVSHHSGSHVKSARETQRHARLLGSLGVDLDPADLDNFVYDRKTALLKDHIARPKVFLAEDGWHTAAAEFPVPADGVKAPESNTPRFSVKGVYFRKIVDVVRSIYEGNTVRTLNHVPFHQFWDPGDGRAPREVFGEIYSSQAMRKAHEEVQAHKVATDPPGTEYVACGLNFYSNATHLTNFSDEESWPVYMELANQSKYTRAKPTAHACHHVAYMPKLPDTFQDFYRKVYNGKTASRETLTHCKRELAQAIVALLIDEEFLEAYVHGILLYCGDNVWRRIFLRIFLWLADYPEKTLLCAMKCNGDSLCPRCHIKRDQVLRMGTKRDMRAQRAEAHRRIDDHPRRHRVELGRKLIFDQGAPLTAKALQELLGCTGAIPTRNALSEKLSQHGFDYHHIFAPNLLHEFELGVWKGIFAHLIRLLAALEGNPIHTLNERYRQILPFGRDTIRKFTANAAGMKRLAARDYEDLLQCAIPAFEGLFPSMRENNIVRQLLFDLATWHGLAKLRLQTSQTMEHFRDSTTMVGDSVCLFIREVCSKYKTKELSGEASARGRRKTACAQHSNVPGTQTVDPTPGFKKINLTTYKFHALGDYPEWIQWIGTTDNTTTQSGELQHRVIKRRFARTNKNNFTAQLAAAESRERMVRRVAQRMEAHVETTRMPQSLESDGPQPAEQRRTDEAPADPAVHYDVAQSAKDWDHITSWLSEHPGDPATNDFLPRLKDHLLTRLRGEEYDGDEQQYSDQDRAEVIILDDKMYHRKTLRINYTTYDLRCEQDTISSSRPDVMVLSCEDDDDSHPYWYARVQRIFHVNVLHCPANTPAPETSERMDVLWVRWFGIDTSVRGGWARKRLHAISFIPSSDPGAFGFLDPMQVIRGIHLIQRFDHGTTDQLLPPSDKDYDYYVNQFVDHDMLMRFCGRGVGHLGTRFLDEKLEKDRCAVDRDHEEDDAVIAALFAEAPHIADDVIDEFAPDPLDADASDEEPDPPVHGPDNEDRLALAFDGDRRWDNEILEDEGFAPL
ncbi:hypothetical protein BC834DRAFT_1045792 [Gloeopeniophorella convolvens]|nr:hypothetical protein BC834DRAFT_1045792 [Gloeopeniophorella convolvens]